MKMVLTLLAVGGPLLGAEEVTIRDVVIAYVQTHSTEKAEKAWLKKWSQRAEQMQNDGLATSEQSAADRVIFDWIADRYERFKKAEITPEERLQVCRWYLLYTSRGWKMDERVEVYLTVENAKKVLGVEVAVAKDVEKK